MVETLCLAVRIKKAIGTRETVWTNPKSTAGYKTKGKKEGAGLLTFL
jgi:hypothetical protein